MTVASLAKGFLMLFLLLLIAGQLGGIGTLELLIWCGLVAVWIAWWIVSRRRSSPRA